MWKIGDIMVFLGVVSIIGAFLFIVSRFASGRWSMRPKSGNEKAGKQKGETAAKESRTTTGKLFLAHGS